MKLRVSPLMRSICIWAFSILNGSMTNEALLYNCPIQSTDSIFQYPQRIDDQ